MPQGQSAKIQSACQILFAGTWFVLDDSPFHVFVLSFALVVTNPAAQIEWLAPIKAELEERLRRWMKIWDIDVVVLNQDLAKRWGLI